MSGAGALDAPELDLLRRAIALSHAAVAHGNHPFGAVLADAGHHVVAEAENTVVTAGDITGHAEINLVRAAGVLDPAVAASMTLYTSCEPCPMCTGAIFWSGIGRVVFALPESALPELTGGSGEWIMRLPCRTVLAAGGRSVEVVGPALADEAAAAHVGSW